MRNLYRRMSDWLRIDAWEFRLSPAGRRYHRAQAMEDQAREHWRNHDPNCPLPH